MSEATRKQQYQSKAKKIDRAQRAITRLDEVLEAGRAEQQKTLQKEIEPWITKAKNAEARHNAAYSKKFGAQLAKRQQLEARIEKLSRQKASIADYELLDTEKAVEEDLSLKDNPSEIALDEELENEELEKEDKLTVVEGGANAGDAVDAPAAE